MKLIPILVGGVTLELGHLSEDDALGGESSDSDVINAKVSDDGSRSVGDVELGSVLDIG